MGVNGLMSVSSSRSNGHKVNKTFLPLQRPMKRWRQKLEVCWSGVKHVFRIPSISNYHIKKGFNAGVIFYSKSLEIEQNWIFFSLRGSSMKCNKIFRINIPGKSKSRIIPREVRFIILSPKSSGWIKILSGVHGHIYLFISELGDGMTSHGALVA